MVAYHCVLSEAFVSAESNHSFGSLGGRQEASVTKIWAILTGLGGIAFAYDFTTVLLEIQVSAARQSESHSHGMAYMTSMPYARLYM